MKTLKSLKNKINGDVLPTRNVILNDETLRNINGGLAAEGSVSCSPCADDCVD